MALRTVGVRLQAEVSGYIAGLRQAKTATRDFAADLDKAARAGHLDAVADQAAGMGLALAGIAAGAVTMAARFDKQMSEVAAVSSATANEMERLREAALQAGKDTAFSATEAAKAQAELAKAGLTTEQILGGALAGSLALAAAGTLDLAESADIAAKTMNVFQLEGKDVGHIADLLAAAANKSATDVHEMGEALRMGGLAANAAGMSLEETVGTLAAFADRALVGSDAGTSLKTALMMLQAPTEKSAALMDELGIKAYDAQGNFVGTAKLAGQLQQALGGLTQEQRNAALAQIFGADAMRAANVMYELGEKGIRDYIAAVDDQGAAADVAAKKMDNLAGDIEKLKGELETLAIEAGSGANGGLRILVQAAEAVVAQFGALPPVLGSTITVLAGVAGAALLMGAGWVRARRATADALAELRETGPAGQRAARGLEATTKWAGRAAAAFVAVELAAAGVRAAVGQNLNPQIEALSKGLAEWAKTGKQAGEATRLLGKDFEHLGYDLSTLDAGFWTGLGNGIAGVIESVTGLGSAFDESLEHARERLSAIDQALTQMVQSGQAAEAAAVFAKLTEEARKQGVSVDELKKGLPGYAAALETAGAASGKAAGQVGAVGKAAEQAAEDVEKLKEAFDALFGIQMDLDRATLQYKQGIVDLKKELLDGARTLDTNTQAGRDNTSAVLDQISKIKALRDARIEHGMAMDQADAKYVAEIDALRRTMLQAGYTKAEVDALIATYRRIPSQVTTTVGANTAGATNAIKGFEKRIRALDGRTITVYARFTPKGDLYIPGQGTQVKNRWGGVYEHAQVGVLREAQIASPVGPARYAWAEPATGGEAFIPKNGDPARSLAILERAASWYGATVAPQQPRYVPGSTVGGGAAASGGTVLVRFDFAGINDEMARAIRKTVRVEGGGNVQVAFGSGSG